MLLYDAEKKKAPVEPGPAAREVGGAGERAPRLKEVGGSTLAHVSLAKSLFQNGRLREALAELDEALRENPDPPWRAPWDSARAELAALVAR